MIQRIQTVYLLLCALGFGALFFAEFASSPQVAEGIWSDSQFSVYDHGMLLAFCGLGCLASFGTIFLYKNRPLQLNMCKVIVGMASALGCFAWYLLSQQDATPYQYGLGWAFPFFTIFFGIMAISFIKKDENTVRSMDRLR
jgi:hypothetical protein